MAPDERARRSPSGSGSSPSGEGSTPIAAALDTPASPEVADPDAEPVAPREARLLPTGDTDRYVLQGVHARGGLGRVVKALDQRLHRTVAIKELLKRTPSAEARFVREALITARLQHPGVVPVHEAGVWPTGDPFYSMKLVSGRTLKELIQTGATLDERMALVPHVLAVAEAIAYAHSQKIIHRDIKPANVIVGDFGETVVVDWGLAKDLSGAVPDDGADGRDAEHDEEPITSTGAGNVMGTPSYMSPEQARGEELDERTDVYSLGALLYEVLVGEPPHTGRTAAAILESALRSVPPAIHERQPGAPADLVAIVRKATARRPEERYPSAVELAEDIRRFQTGQLVTARHYSTRSLVRRWMARHRSVVAVAAAAMVGLAVIGTVAVQRVLDQRNVARAERALAQRAKGAAEERSDELAFMQAQSSLARDPTTALAWLKTYPATGRRAPLMASMVDEAIALGVSRHILRHPIWVMGADFTDDGYAVTADMDGRVVSWDLTTGRGREIGRSRDGAWMTRLSPDRRLVAVGGKRGTVTLFASDGSGTPKELKGHRDMIESLVFSRDGGRLLSATMGDLRVWDVASGETVLAARGDGVIAGQLLPDGGAMLVSRMSGEISVVPIDGTPDGGAPRRLARFDAPVHRMAVSPAGDRLLAHAVDKKIRLIDMASGKVREVGEQDARLGWAVFSPSGARAATGGIDGTIRLFDVATGQETVLRGHDDSIYTVEFSPDESFLVSASDDGTARLWDLRSTEVRVLRGHEDDVYRATIRWDGRAILTCSLDGTARLWPLDAGSARVLPPSPGETYNLRFVGGGKQLLSFGRGKVLTWDVASGTRTAIEAAPERGKPDRAKYDEKAKSGDPVWSESGHLVAGAVPGNQVVVVDVAQRTTRALTGHREPVSLVSMSADGRTLVTGDRSGLVLVWNLSAAAPVARVMFEKRPAVAAALSPDGTRLALGGDGTLELFDLATGASVRKADLASVDSEHRSAWLIFSPDGRMVVSPSRGETLLWELDTGSVRRLDREGHHVVWVAFSPDSRTLAVSQSDRSIRLLSTVDWSSRTLDGHRDLVMRLAFTADGTTMASSSYDKTIRLWDVASGELVRVLRGHVASVDVVAFSPDGRTLASAGRDGTVRLWDLAALPPSDAGSVRRRLEAATSAVIDNGRATTRASVDAASLLR